MLLGQSLGRGINTCLIKSCQFASTPVVQNLNPDYAMTPLSIASMFISVSIMMLTLSVYRLIVVGLTSLFDWPVFFRFFSSVPPPQVLREGIQEPSLDLSCSLGQLMYALDLSSLWFFCFGDSYLCFSFQFSDDVVYVLDLFYLEN